MPIDSMPMQMQIQILWSCRARSDRTVKNANAIEIVTMAIAMDKKTNQSISKRMYLITIVMLLSTGTISRLGVSPNRL